MFAYYAPHSLITSKLARPTAIGLSKADRDNLGIGYLDQVSARQVNAGPDGEMGWLFFRDVPGCCHAFERDKQTWQRMPFPNDIWIGYETSLGMPKPSSLQRPNLMPGQSVTLGDDRVWAIPAACQWDDDVHMSCTLPRSIRITDDGSWTLGDVVPAYRKLWTYLSDYLDEQDKAVDGRFNFEPINDWCTLALQANYFVGPSEVSIMSLLNQQTRSQLIQAIIDIDTYINVLQKKSLTLDTGDTSFGPSESTPDSPATIDPPTPTGSTTT